MFSFLGTWSSDEEYFQKMPSQVRPFVDLDKFVLPCHKSLVSRPVLVWWINVVFHFWRLMDGLSSLRCSSRTLDGAAELYRRREEKELHSKLCFRAKVRMGRVVGLFLYCCILFKYCLNTFLSRHNRQPSQQQEQPSNWSRYSSANDPRARFQE